MTATATRRFVNAEALGAPRGAYSHAVEAHGVVYGSAIGPFAPGDGSVPEGVAAQTAAALDNIERLLATEFGLGLGDVVRITLILSDFERDFAAASEVYAARFAVDPPARTVIGAVLPGPLVAMDFIAARP
ncbi:RidA family protein [Rathayibacter sp. VKM Ac-2856]|uniref:RidA family protein n=1 Tax=unclassified Rathayibacter TaxID=2609250 RepID=UPI0015639DB3|nr:MULTISPECIES: RidA family protein [unclassified Rathayibacter]NQX05097.1 RidA family protein [Rathayibacter sp. VKM Ac-2858]NQX20264.1 RidA family protein [Rathayibacter sp. VKM Ac-2856]